MNIKILEATPIYAEDFTYVFCKSWKEAYKNIIPQEDIQKNTNPEKRKQMFTRLMLSEDGYFFIAYDDTSPCGIVYARKNIENNIEIIALYTTSNYWGKGVGKKLMDTLIETVKNGNIAKIKLWTLENNLRARKFYEKYGFKSVNEVKDSGIADLKEISYIMEI